MNTTIVTLLMAASFGAVALPAFAEGEGSRVESAASLPPGFYNGTPMQLQAQSKQEWFASQPKPADSAVTSDKVASPNQG
jgi:hypothetical protein